MSKLNVRYVGRKPSRTDTVAGTGITWVGEGDVQAVPAEAWPALSKHPDIWQLVLEDEPQQPTAVSPGPSLSDADPQQGAAPGPSLHAMSRDDLFALAVSRGLDPRQNAAKPALLKLLGA